MKKDKQILIPDEFVPDYSLPEDEQKKQWDEYRENSKEAFEKLSIKKD